MQSDLQEYWVNVYKSTVCGCYDYQWHEDRKILIQWGVPKPLYRIHVKMKPVKYDQVDKNTIVERATGNPVKLDWGFPELEKV